MAGKSTTFYSTLGLIFSLIIIHSLFAQHSKPDTIYALQTSEKIRVDGHLNEAVWQQAVPISNFTQRELQEGLPATETTKVAIIYDKKILYIGIWCYDKEPDKIIARKMQRDFHWNSDDNIEIIIDTYHNKRDGYLFVTNPNGARADAMIMDNGQLFNKSWDGVWDVKTQINSQGWFAEIQIPFSTLKFDVKEQLIWGINFERNIRRKLEQVMWQGWSRDSELEQVSRAGTLIGLQGLQNVNMVEIKPYGLAGIQKEQGSDQETTANLGGDINYLITPTLKLNLTLNTDFAQVESDKAQINLSRFSLYYPEKREFFLEGKDYFDFSLGRRIQPFYSRKIGIGDNGEVIPIIGGARVLGKAGRATLGAMSLQTAAKDSTPSTNFSVLRWKQDVGEQSSAGLIGVGKFEPNRHNVVAGGDYLYSTSNFLQNKNLFVGGSYAMSYTSDAENKTGSAHRFFISLPTDFVEYDFVWLRSDKNFNPEAGFLRRTNYQMLKSELQFNPRPTFLPGIKQLEIKPMDVNYFFNDETGQLITLEAEFRPLGFETMSGEFIEFNIIRNAENLEEDFEIHEDIIIPMDEYWFTTYEIQLYTFSGRPVFAYSQFSWGDFFNGSREQLSLFLIWRINKHLSISTDIEKNRIKLPDGSFNTHEYGADIQYNFTPNLFSSIFGQWNSNDDEVILNFRFNWIPKPGANLYFIVNQSFDTGRHTWIGTNTAVITKLIWRFEI